MLRARDARRNRRRIVHTPRGYCTNPLRRPRSRCYPLRALGAGGARGWLRDRWSEVPEPLRLNRHPAASQRPNRRAFPCPRRVARDSSIRHCIDRQNIDRMDAKQVWRAALGELQVSLSPANYETWLKETALVDVDDQRFRIAVPNGFAKDWLETRYRSLISQTLARIVGYSVQVEFIVNAAEAPATDVSANGSSNGSASVRVEPTRVGGEGGTTNINPRYTFANFIVGSANRLAHAASLSVAERPGHAYNPLFLYGGVGLGKTHLMHAIGNQVIAKFPRKRVVYATSEKFTNEFITSIQQGKIDEFRGRYRRIDLLLIDDIQFIADKERTQEEFFHTFNAIHEDGKQIVLTSDRPPKAILTLEERLRSRFEWGLIADIQPPDLETRIAILRAKAETMAVQVPGDVIDFIARKVQSNIRELEGALNRVIAYAQLNNASLTVDFAAASLNDLQINPRRRPITHERIVETVSSFFNLEPEDLKTGSRS